MTAKVHPWFSPRHEAISLKDHQDLKKVGFNGGNVDPCHYIKKSSNTTVYVALYIDVNSMVGNHEVIDEVIEALQKYELLLKVVEDCRTIFRS